MGGGLGQYTLLLGDGDFRLRASAIIDGFETQFHSLSSRDMHLNRFLKIPLAWILSRNQVDYVETEARIEPLNPMS